MLTAHTARHRSGRAELTAYQDERNAQCVLYAQGAFDTATTSVLLQTLGQVCRTRVPRIVIECSAVTFADIAFLRALLSSRSHDTQVVLAAPSLAVCRLLEVTETTGHFLTTQESPSTS